MVINDILDMASYNVAAYRIKNRDTNSQDMEIYEIV